MVSVETPVETSVEIPLSEKSELDSTYQRDIYYIYYYDKKTKKKYDKEETTKRI